MYVYATLLNWKLPNVIRDHINREGQTDLWDLDKLRQAIETDIGHLQATDSVDDKHHVKLSNNSSNELHNEFSLSVATNNNPYQRKCHLCGSGLQITRSFKLFLRDESK